MQALNATTNAINLMAMNQGCGGATSSIAASGATSGPAGGSDSNEKDGRKEGVFSQEMGAEKGGASCN